MSQPRHISHTLENPHLGHQSHAPLGAWNSWMSVVMLMGCMHAR